MKKTKRSCDAIVDAFVAAVHRAPREGVFREKIHRACLLSAGKWPDSFDCGNSRPKAEPAIVRVDHEEILCNGRRRVVEQLAAGFDVLLEETTSALEAKIARST